MSAIDDFLQHNIDGYLAYDLATMSQNDVNGRGGLILSASGGILRVDSVSDRRLTSVLERSDLILAKGPEIPP